MLGHTILTMRIEEGTLETRVRMEHAWKAEPCPRVPVVGVHENDARPGGGNH